MTQARSIEKTENQLSSETAAELNGDFNAQFNSQIVRQVTWRELFSLFGKIGLLSFGGPAAQIAMLQHSLVDQKRWLDQERFLHALNFCMLLPGPEAMQLATYAGWTVKGWRGGLLAGLLFVLPGAAIMMALSAAYVFYGQVDWVSGFLFGLKAAVLAVVFDALWRMSKRILKTRAMFIIAILAFILIAFLQMPFPAVVLGSAAIGAILFFLNPQKTLAVTPPDTAEVKSAVQIKSTLIWQLIGWVSLWVIPLLIVLGVFGAGHVFADEAVFFSKLALVSFGGAYAALTYTAQQAVELFGWLNAGEMLTGLGLAETTPGPLILVLLFVGFVGAAKLSGLSAALGGSIGGLIALWFTFVPCFLWVFAGAPFIERLRQIRWLSSMLSAVTAAVVGVIANLSLWLMLRIFFEQVEENRWSIFYISVPEWSSVDWLAIIIAGLAAFALSYLRWSMAYVLLVAAIGGVLIKLIL